MRLDLIILGLLARKPFSGYDLLKWFEVEGKFIRSRLHHSQIYRALGRMVTDGLVCFEVDPREGRPDAKVYRLTPVGREALLDAVRAPFDPPSRFTDPDFRVRFVFTAGLDLDATIALIDAELDYRCRQVAENRNRDRTVELEDPAGRVDAELAALAVELDHEYGAAAVDAWIAHLRRARTRLLAQREERGQRRGGTR
ncbi:PadR family transcriptional regulator [Streptomyces sp. NPDC127039]|uniref:PadR family transcriptional regulator n=1 Tax=Streptomyces sp. NPDC127039 TaxID=3347115 RepID=UPI00365FFC45